MPLAPEKGIDVPIAKAVDGLNQLTLKREPAHFAIGDHLESRRLLQRDRLIDGTVLDPLELRPRHVALGQRRPRRQQLGRVEQASDNIGVGGDHRTLGRGVARFGSQANQVKLSDR